MDSFLDQEMGEGTLDSSGTFTIDLKRALKLSRLATQPRNYPVLLVGLAVLCQASCFDLRFSPGRTTVTFDGAPLQPEVLESLSQAFLAPSPGAQLYLARALQAAMLLPAVQSIRVTSGLRTLEVQGAKIRSRAALSEWKGTRVELTEGLRKLTENPMQRAEVASLLAYCRWARLRIRVNDRSLWEGRGVFLRENFDVEETRSYPTVRLPAGVFWFPPEDRGPTRVTLVENGISYGPVCWDLDLPGGEGALFAQGIPKDLSLLNLRHDAEWLQAEQERLHRELALAAERIEPVVPTPRSVALVERASLEPLATEIFGSRVAILGRVALKIWSLEGRLLVETSVAARPGSSTLAGHGPWVVAGGAAAVLLDCQSGQVLRRFVNLSCAAFRRDGSLLACACGEEIGLYRVSSGLAVRHWRTAAPVAQLGWHPHGEWLFTLSPKGQLSLWTAQGQALAGPLKHSPGQAEFSPRGDLLAFGGLLYRCPGDEIHLGAKLPVYQQIRFLQDGDSFVGQHRGGIEVRRSGDGQLLWGRPKCQSFELSPDRQQLALTFAESTEFTDAEGAASPDWMRPSLGAQAGCLSRLEWGAESLVATGPHLAYRLSRQGCLGRSQVLAACEASLADAAGVCDWTGERLLELPLAPPVQVSAHALVAGGVLRRPTSAQILGSWEGADFVVGPDLVVIRSSSGVKLRRLGDQQAQLLTQAPIGRMALSGDGSHLVLQHRSAPRLEVWHLHPPRRLFVETGASWPWALSEDGAVLALGNPLRILATDRPQARQRFETGVAEGLFVNSTHVVQAGPGGTQLFRHDGSRVCQLACSPWTSVAFRPDGRVLAGLDEESRIHFFTLSGAELGTFHPFADGQWVASEGLLSNL